MFGQSKIVKEIKSQTVRKKYGVGNLRFHLRGDPSVEHIEDLFAVRLQHHEMAVAQDAFFLQRQVLRITPRLLQKCADRLAAPSRSLGGYIDDWNPLQVFQFAR